LRRIVLTLATGFGLGLSPLIPGTVGSLLGVLAVFILRRLSLAAQILWVLGLTLAAVPLSTAAEDYLKKKDDPRIVVDEYITFPICMLGLPWMQHWWLLVVGFVVNRIMDIVKPFPARQAQALYGGLGIVLDDAIAGVYALAINHVIFRLVTHWSW